MRVLALAPHPFYIDRGSPIDFDLLLRALSNRGEEVEAIVYSVGEDREYLNVRIHRTRAPRWLGLTPPGFSLRKLLNDILVFVEARRLIRTSSFDVIHAVEETVFLAMIFKALYKLPYIYDMDSSISQQMVEQLPILRPLRSLLDWCEKRAISGSIAVAPVCNALADLASRRGAEYVVTLHDISQLSPAHDNELSDLRKELGSDGVFILYVGNLAPYQGVDLLFEGFALAARKDPTLHLGIAGGSPKRINQYEEMANRLRISDRSHFLGPWPAANLGTLLRSADILAAPRIRGINTPMKIFPYLHSGKAVLATDLPTHNQLLDSSVAYLAPPTADGFANGILVLAHDSDLRHQLGAAGQEFVEENHTFDAHQTRVNRLYEWVQTRCEIAV